MFRELLKAANSRGWDLNTPHGVLALLELLDAVDDEEPDGTIEAAIATLHDYVHFRMESAADPEQWHEVDDVANDLMADPFPGADILDAAIAEAEQIDPDERRSALGDTRIISAIPELVAWIGSGRKVSPSGGLRRVDIAHGAGLLGDGFVRVVDPDRAISMLDGVGFNTPAVPVFTTALADVTQ